MQYLFCAIVGYGKEKFEVVDRLPKLGDPWGNQPWATDEEIVSIEELRASVMNDNEKYFYEYYRLLTINNEDEECDYFVAIDDGRRE